MPSVPSAIDQLVLDSQLRGP